MQIKMLTRYAGPSGTCKPGEVITLSEKEAKSLISGGYALSVSGKNKNFAATPGERVDVRTPSQMKDGQPESEQKDREEQILDAVRMVIEEDNKSNLIANGSPSVGVLEDLLDFDITPAERDAAFLKVR